MSELFSNLGIEPKLLFAQIVNFLLVLWLLKRFVFKRIMGFLEERKKGIERGIELTKKAEREIERIDEARKVAMGKAKKLAEGLVIEAKNRGITLEKEIISEADLNAKNLLDKAKKEAERKKQDILKEAKAEMQKSAFLLAEKVLTRSLTKEDEVRIGQDLLKEVKEHGKES